jgi:hypothetical protein
MVSYCLEYGYQLFERKYSLHLQVNIERTGSSENLFSLEDGSDIFLRNVGNRLQDYSTS